MFFNVVHQVISTLLLNIIPPDQRRLNLNGRTKIPKKVIIITYKLLMIVVSVLLMCDMYQYIEIL